MKAKSYLITCFLLAAIVIPRVQADSCMGASSVAATNKQYKVNGQYDAESKEWNYVLINLKTGKKRTGSLPLFKFHSHLQFYLSQDGTRFAVLNPSADHHLSNRFVIYDSDGKLISSLGVDDILIKDEHQGIRKSVSHMQWLKYDPALESYGQYISDSNTVRLTTVSGRKVLIALSDGKIIDKGKYLGFKNKIMHQVQIGETLSGIAKAHGVSVESIIELNKIENPDRIKAHKSLELLESVATNSCTNCTITIEEQPNQRVDLTR